MKAQLWKIKICSGPLEMVHGFSQKILDVYIPSFNISLNIAEDKINCFSTYEGRYSGNKGSTLVKTFDFPDYIVDALLLHISSTEKFTEKFTDPIKKVFSNFIEVVKKNKKIDSDTMLAVEKQLEEVQNSLTGCGRGNSL